MSFLPLKGLLSAALSLLLILPLAARAIGGLNLSLGDLSGPGWKVEQLRLELDWSQPQQTVYSLSARQLIHSALPTPLESPRFECHAGVIDDREVRCDQGVLYLQSPLLDQPRFPATFHWDRRAQQLSVLLDRVHLGDGEVTANLMWGASAWRLKLHGSGLSLPRLQQGMARMGFPITVEGVQGVVSPKLQAAGTPQGMTAADWNLTLRQGAFSRELEGAFAEGLEGSWKGKIRLDGGEWRGDQRLQLKRGALLTPWLYLDPEGEQITLNSDFRFNPETGQLAIERLQFQHPQHLAFSAAGILRTAGAIKPLKFEILTQPADPGILFDSYLAPVLGDDLSEQLKLKGRLTAGLKLDPDPSLEIRLEDVALVLGGEGGGSLRGLDGELHWSAVKAQASALSWQAGALFGRLKIGPTHFDLQLKKRGLLLRQPAGIPILDGKLQLEKLALQQGEAGLEATFQGYLEPISMTLLSQALSWPELAGQLSGMIPEVSLKEGVLSVGGIMLVRLFGGSILIRNLRLEAMTGPLPVMMADIELKGLDLETLTRTFSFGKITGRLNGQVDGLRLEGWRPVAFDARFSTPAGDDSRHRISQKAVDNLSNLGGSGVSGALSRSFLRMFEEFGYDRLGISCRLRNGVCEMGGIEPAASGYYLVKGGGVPRIDIVGFNRSIDWELLVRKLQQVSAGGSPVIE